MKELGRQSVLGIIRDLESDPLRMDIEDDVFTFVEDIQLPDSFCVGLAPPLQEAPISEFIPFEKMTIAPVVKEFFEKNGQGAPLWVTGIQQSSPPKTLFTPGKVSPSLIVAASFATAIIGLKATINYFRKGSQKQLPAIVSESPKQLEAPKKSIPQENYGVSQSKLKPGPNKVEQNSTPNKERTSPAKESTSEKRKRLRKLAEDLNDSE